MRTPESHISTETKLKRIAWLSERDPHKVFNNLMHLLNEESLKACFNELDERKAVGIDGIDKAAYRRKNQFKLKDIWKKFCIKMEGHIRYYGTSFNISKVRDFLHQGIRILFKWFNRRSQRKSFDWEKFNLFMKSYPPPKVRIYFALF